MGRKGLEFISVTIIYFFLGKYKIWAGPIILRFIFFFHFFLFYFTLICAGTKMDKTSRKRTHLSSTQVSQLESSFQENSLPDSSIRSRLAKKLSISERTVQIWFQNRRAKQKKMKVYLRDQKQDLPRYQPTFRSLMTPKAFEEPQIQTFRERPRSISKPEPKSLQLLSDIELMQQNQRAMSEDLTISQSKYK